MQENQLGHSYEREAGSKLCPDEAEEVQQPIALQQGWSASQLCALGQVWAAHIDRMNAK